MRRGQNFQIRPKSANLARNLALFSQRVLQLVQAASAAADAPNAVPRSISMVGGARSRVSLNLLGLLGVRELGSVCVCVVTMCCVYSVHMVCMPCNRPPCKTGAACGVGSHARQTLAGTKVLLCLDTGMHADATTLPNTSDTTSPPGKPRPHPDTLTPHTHANKPRHRWAGGREHLRRHGDTLHTNSKEVHAICWIWDL